MTIHPGTIMSSTRELMYGVDGNLVYSQHFQGRNAPAAPEPGSMTASFGSSDRIPLIHNRAHDKPLSDGMRGDMDAGGDVDAWGPGALATWEVYAEAGVIGAVTLAIIVSNILTIVCVMSTNSLKDAVGYYLVSMATADLICGLLVTPLSVYPTLVQEWIYGDIVCKVVAHLEIMLCAITIYSFMWLAVDRYIAVRKPQRYETNMSSKMRCKCWIVFTWVTSLLVSCPPLFGYSRASYYRPAAICLLDWSFIPAYSVALAVIVLTPCSLTVMYCYWNIFKSVREQKEEILEEASKKGTTVCFSDHFGYRTYRMTFLVTMVTSASWTPWILLQIWEAISSSKVDPRPHFCFMWLAIGACFWKFVIFYAMHPKFRKGLRFMCCMKSRQRSRNRQYQY